MSKYRLKRRTNQTFVIAIVMISLLVSVSIGYSLWSDTIFIHVNSNLRYVEPKLENIEFVKDSDGDYVSRTEDIDLSAGSKVLTFNGDSLIETIDANTNRLDLSVNYTVKSSWIVSGRTVYITFNFTNNNSVPLTLGSYELIEKTLDYSPTFTMPETIAVGETGHFETSFFMKGNGYLKQGKLVYKIKYQVGEVTRYMYFTITLVK